MKEEIERPTVKQRAVASHPLLIAISLKMYFGYRDTLRWCDDVLEIACQHPLVTSGTVGLVLLPGFLTLAEVSRRVCGTRIYVGAQDVSWAERGPFTGEVSASELREVGCCFVEIGHSERRQMFAEGDADIARKIAAARRCGLIPLVCVGESERLSARAAADHAVAQMDSLVQLASIDDWRQTLIRPELGLVVAYEPIWAIGAQEAAPREHILAVCSALQGWLKTSDLVRGIEGLVLYGGSAGSGLLDQVGRAMDGLFLGRFAHDPVNFRHILDDTQEYALTRGIFRHQ